MSQGKNWSDVDGPRVNAVEMLRQAAEELQAEDEAALEADPSPPDED